MTPERPDFQALGSKLEECWSTDRAARVYARVNEARARRTSPWSQIAFGVVALAVAVTVGVGAWFGDTQPTAKEAMATGLVQVTALTASTTVVDEHSEGSRVYRLLKGSARFRVRPQPEQPVLVHAASVTVEVIGTVFEVSLLDEEQVTVSVRRGQVRVRWPEGSQVLETGDVSTFPEAPMPARSESPAPGAAPEPPAAPSASVTSASSNQPELATRWRHLANAGDYRGAFAAIERTPNAVTDTAEDLLLAADAARLSGHAADAVVYLRKVLKQHPGNARAPLAAFTLGRVLLDELSRPAEAAEAFAIARAHGGMLSEDALAREALARQRAGQTEAAQRLATKYLNAHPQGRWATQLSSVQRGAD